MEMPDSINGYRCVDVDVDVKAGVDGVCLMRG